MAQLVLVVVLVVVAVLVALVLQRRTRPDAPVQGRSWTVPGQLARNDFADPTRSWLVVLFSSDTCDTCAGAWETVRVLAAEDVAVQRLPWQQNRRIHDQYGIDAVPTVLVADAEGVVRASFVGQPSPEEIGQTMTRLMGEGSPTLLADPARRDDV